MKNEKIRGLQALDLSLANVQWTFSKWLKWCIRNNAGLIIEDGKVTGWDIETARYHK